MRKPYFLEKPIWQDVSVAKLAKSCRVFLLGIFRSIPQLGESQPPSHALSIELTDLVVSQNQGAFEVLQCRVCLMYSGQLWGRSLLNAHSAFAASKAVPD